MEIKVLADADAVAREGAKLITLEMLPRLRAAHVSVRTGQVRQEHALALVDRAAAAKL